MRELVCIVCPKGCLLKITKDEDSWNIEGHFCSKGKSFAIEEMTSARRTLASTVKTIYKKVPRLPVRTDGEIPKGYILPLMDRINKVTVKKPIHSGDIVLENVFGTGINVISTSDMYYLLEGDFNG